MILARLLVLVVLVTPATANGQTCPSAGTAPRVAPATMLDVARLTLARCVMADIGAGRWRAADARLQAAAVAGNAVAAPHRADWHALIARLHARRHMDGRQWATLASHVVPFEDALPWVGPLVRGVASARASWAQQDSGLQASARHELERLTTLAREAGPLSDAEHARLLVQGAMAGAQYERDEMQLLLEAAHELEQRMSAGDELRMPVALAWELEADLLLVTDRHAAASERYRDLLVEHPGRVQARLGLAEAYRRLGFGREAEETRAQAAVLWADADPEPRALFTAQP